MSAADDRKVEFARTEITRSDFVRKHYDEDWTDLIDLYMNYTETVMPEGAEWIHNKMIADGFRIVETITPQIVLGMYNSPRWFATEAPGVPGENYQRMVHALLTWMVDQCRFVERSIPEVRMAQILGHSIQKTYWHVEQSEGLVRLTEPGLDESGQIVPVSRLEPSQRTSFNGAWVEWPDLKDVWKSVNVDRFGRHWWYNHARDTTVDMLELENANYGNLLYTNLKPLRDKVSLRPTQNSSGFNSPYELAGFDFGGPFGFDNIQDQISNVPRHMRMGDGAVKIWEWWGYVPPKVASYQDTQWRLWEIANGETLIRDHPAPSHDRRPPFDDNYTIRVGKEPYGRSVLHFLKDEIEQTSIFRNLRQADVLMNLFGTYAADADIDFDQSGLSMEPNGILWYRNGGQGHKGIFEPIPRQPMPQSAYLETQLMEDHYLKASGAPEPFQGGFAPGGSHRTLGEFSGTVNLGGARHRVAIMLNDLQSKLPYLMRAFKLAQIYLEDPVMLELANDHGARDGVTFRELLWDVQIKVDTGEFGQIDQQKLNALIQLYATFTNDPEGAMAHDKRTIMEDAYFYAGFSRGDRYLKSQREIDAAMEQARSQAILEAALSGSDSMESGPRAS